MSGLSAAMIVQLEKGNRRAGKNTAISLGRALGATPSFIADNRETFGILCTINGKKAEISLDRYQHEKGINNIRETTERPAPMPESKVAVLRETLLPHELAAVMEARERPFIEREIIDDSKSVIGNEDELRETLTDIVSRLDKNQLHRAIRLLQEVIED